MCVRLTHPTGWNFTVQIIEDGPDGVWVTGLPATTRLITVGQEFVTVGETIDPIYLTQSAPGCPAVTSIIESAISRTRTTLSLLAAIVVAGIGRARALPIANDPHIEVPFFYIGVAHEGISPRMPSACWFNRWKSNCASSRACWSSSPQRRKAWRHFLLSLMSPRISTRR